VNGQRDPERIPASACIVLALLFAAALALPYAVHSWGTTIAGAREEHHLFWNWSGFGSDRHRANPGLMACFWLSSALLLGLGATWAAAKRLHDRGRLWFASAAVLSYACLRLPFDLLALSWPGGAALLAWPGVLRLAGIHLNADAFQTWPSWGLCSEPNPPSHYLVLLRTCLTLAAVIAPFAVFVRRRLLGPEAWKCYAALALLAAFALPYASNETFAWNWSGRGAFSNRIEPIGWFWAGGALLPLLAVLWGVSWVAGRGGFAVALLGAGAYLLLRLRYDLLSLGDLPYTSLKNPALFLPAFWVILRVHLTGLAVFYPLLRGASERFGLPRVSAADTLIHTLASAAATWVLLAATFAQEEYRGGGMVGLRCTWREPAVYGLVAPLAAVVGYWLLITAERAVALQRGSSRARELVFRCTAAAWSAGALPFLMLLLAQWHPYLI